MCHARLVARLIVAAAFAPQPWASPAQELNASRPQSALPDRGDAVVTTTRTFAFYSDPVFNLHDFLVWNARSQEPVEPAAECFTGLPAAQRAAFEHAREHYQVFATPTGNRLLRELRYRLAGFDNVRVSDVAALETALAQLLPAVPAYRQCWWPAHDARNRRWIAALEPLLEAHEDSLTERLSELYGEELGSRPFTVDVVSYGSAVGADSLVNPDHLLVSSIAPSNAGYPGLEIVFHEASHTVFGPGLAGRLWTEFDAAEKADGAPQPSEFWHALLFFTTGSAVQARLSEAGVDYEQYVYSAGLLEQSAWSAYAPALERLWQPYVDGRVPMTDAVQQIVAAPKLPDRGAALVATSGTFAFYSDLVTNLHDFLVWNVRSPDEVEPKPECLADLPAEQRDAFEQARGYYARTFANDAGQLILLSMRWRLAKLGEFDLADPAAIAATVAALAPAAPAYERCWWPAHDARNRRWIASLLPLLEANDDALRARLAELYGQQLSRFLPVDVVGYASFSGSSTVFGPHQILISSAKPANQGYAALEVVFHEASHTLFGPRTPGPLWQALQQASRDAAKPVTEDLSHLLLFFTTGKAVQARLAEQGVSDYNPYAYAEGLMERSAPAHREALERVWQSYVDGRVPMAEATRQLIEALPAAPR